MKVAVFNDTSGGGHFGCDLVMSRLYHYLDKQGFETLWTYPSGVDWRPIANELAGKPRVDAIIVNGEGSIHHSSRNQKAAYLSALAPFARERLGIPAYLINATITELSPEAIDDLRVFERIYVRESGSAVELADAKVDATVVPDLTLSIGPVQTAEPKSGVLVTDSVRKTDSVLLSKLARDRGWTLHPIQERKKRWFSLPWLRSSEGPTEDFLHVLSSKSFVVTGRFHTVTLAIAAGVPFVALESNTPKISSLVKDVFGNARRVVTSDVLRRADLSQFDRWTLEEFAAVRSFAQNVPARVETMFSDIKRSIAAYRS
jgi:polysaccharide pyruvyl transferase WcaK-like protein